MKFNVVTLGCKVNSYESEAILNEFIKRGWEYAKQEESPDVIVINTCTVTSTSDQKSRQMIRKIKRENPSSLVIAMGCYVQLHPDEASNIADVVVGTFDRLKIFEVIDSYLNTKKEITDIVNNNYVNDISNVTSFEEMKVNLIKTHTRGFVKIQDGCENYCSYCAIPYARGKIRSRRPMNVISEINNLVNSGVKEVIIAGINTGTYGQDLGNINLAKLIEKIMNETSLYRLRLSSIELMEVTDELLNVIKKYETRVANHLHIPLQGGSDSVLKRMNRKYLTTDYRNLINKIRTMFPNMAITTDLLAGFVGETEAEFNDTCSFIQEMKFSMMHIFPYSRRKGTKADLMEGHLDPKVINERTHILLNIAKKMQIEYEEKFINESFDVITEQKKNGYYLAHSSNYLEINLPIDKNMKDNMIIKTKIIKYENHKLIGERE